MRARLQNVPILAGLDESAVNFLWERTKETAVVAGSVIVSEGEAGNRFFLVGEGTVRVCRHWGQPNELELARISAGDFFGEMCILETLPRSATVQAVQDTTLYSLSSLVFHDLYKAMPAQYSILILNIARDLSRRMRKLHGIIDARH